MFFLSFGKYSYWVVCWIQAVGEGILPETWFIDCFCIAEISKLERFN